MRPRLYAYYIVVAIVLLAGVYVLKKKNPGESSLLIGEKKIRNRKL